MIDVRNIWVLLTSVLCRLVGRHGAQVAQVALVADKHDDNVLVGMIAQLAQPSLNIFIRHVLKRFRIILSLFANNTYRLPNDDRDDVEV